MSSRRLNLIKAHLNGSFPSAPRDSSIDNYRQRGMSFNSDQVKRFIFGARYQEVYKVIDMMAQSPLFDISSEIELSREQIRGKVIDQIIEIFPHTEITSERSDNDPELLINYIQSCSIHSSQFSVRQYVHLGLYADSINLLGSQKHKIFYQRAYEMKDYGCFAMTEIGHGSNVNGVETTATYNHENREFIINSPSATATKVWIGALGKTANMSVVFAQLVINEKKKGVHAFLIPIRDRETHKPLPGLIIGDMGAKIGLPGIDNGFMVFNDYRVGYDSLLDNLSQINEKGEFLSTIKSAEKRFALTIGGLTRGRIVVMLSNSTASLKASIIGLRYSAVRRQFGPNQQENAILDYQLQRFKLIPGFARLIAQFCLNNQLKKMYVETRKLLKANPEAAQGAELHALLSISKAITGWYSIGQVNKIREATASMGYSSYSLLKQLRGEADINLTWEGDNEILFQQTSRFLLRQFQRLAKQKQPETKYVEGLDVDKDRVRGKRSLIDREVNVEHLQEALIQRFNLVLHNTLELMAQYKDPVAANLNSMIFGQKDLAIAFIELVASKLMLCDIISVTDENSRNYLSKITKLYMCDCLERGSSDLIGFINQDQLYYIRDEILKLTSDVAEHIITFIDSLQIPDKFLGVLGHSDGQVYQHFAQTVERFEDKSTPEWVESYVSFKNRDQVG